MSGASTKPAKFDWGVYAGDRNQLAFDLLANGEPWDITGCELLAQARVRSTEPVVALTATITVVDAELGQVRIAWNGEAVREALAGAATASWEWDFQIQAPGWELPDTLLQGRLSAEMDKSRAGTP